MAVRPDRSTFLDLAAAHAVVPVSMQVLADRETAVTAYEKLVEDIVLAAEIETTIRKLLVDIEKTKRRVNALEFKVIPELTEAAAFITFRLEEMERENTFRLKMIKQKSQAKAAVEAEASAG